MTSTSFSVGLGGEGRSSSNRVLKPPGGGTSDIFGVGEPQQSPRKVKQYMASNINLSDEVPASSGPGSTASTTSSNGSAPETPSSPTRNGTELLAPQAPPLANAQAPDDAPAAPVVAAGNLPDGESRGRNFQMQSHFTLGYDKSPSPVKGEVGPVQEDYPAAGNLQRTRDPDNPVTGEGFGLKSNGSAAGSTAPRTRVPPGGYSSGLW